MRQKLLEVDDHFYLERLGLVLAGKYEKNLPIFKIGSSIILSKPNGEEIKTKINGIEMFSPSNFGTAAFSVLGLTKGDVPIGTIVFLNTPK